MTDSSWMCPNCNLFLPHVRRFPIHCRCGQISNKPPIKKTLQKETKSKEKQPVSQDETKRREAICEECWHFLGNSCDAICKGCSRKWQQAVRQGGCPEGNWKKRKRHDEERAMDERWSYGITTVPSRVTDGLLKRTIDSLDKAGFPNPVIFIDGPCEIPKWLKSYRTVTRPVQLKAFGNWVLAAWELYLRKPQAKFYGIFQDDCIAVKNLRRYLSRIDFPDKGYLNLYTFPQNEKPIRGFYSSNQKGKGAVGLVMDHAGIRTILRAQHMVNRPCSSNKHRAVRSIDGGIVTGFKKAGWREYVHNPSLLQHIGDESVIGNNPQKKALTFPGEDFDALELLDDRTESVDVRSANQQRELKQAPAGSVGLAGAHGGSKLAVLNYQIAKYLHPDVWMIKEERRPGGEQPDTLVESVIDDGDIDRFLDKAETIVFVETPSHPGLLEQARKRNRRIVCIPMLEWTPTRGWPGQVDLFLCPTKQCYNALSKDGLPCIFFPWPVDIDGIPFQARRKCERFLYINESGGYRGCRGARAIQEAKQIWPEMPLEVFADEQNGWPSETIVRPSIESRSDMYSGADCLLLPEMTNGLPLELLEAMAGGLSVIATCGQPWHEYPVRTAQVSGIEMKTVQRDVPWHTVDSQKLVDKCREIYNQPILAESKINRAYAESRSWSNLADEFRRTILRAKNHDE